MARLILLLALTSMVGAQRRRERRPVASSSRPLFAPRDEPAPLVGEAFMPSFDWEGPDWGFGFKESKKVELEAVEPREYVEEPVQRLDFQRPRKRVREEALSREEMVQLLLQEQAEQQHAQRRSDVGRRRRPSKVLQEQEPEEGTYRVRNRIRAQERPRLRQEDFATPSRVEVVQPVGLSRSSVKVAEQQREFVGESEHPGSISLGLFGGGNIGGRAKAKQGASSSRGALPEDEMERPGRFEEEQLQGAGGFPREEQRPGWNDRAPSSRRDQFRPNSKPFQENRIRPQRWRPSTERSLIGSPFFQLEYDEDEPEIIFKKPEPEIIYKKPEPKTIYRKPESEITYQKPKPKKIYKKPDPEVLYKKLAAERLARPTWSQEPKEMPEHRWSMEKDTEGGFTTEPFKPSTPSNVGTTSKKSFFLPTLNPYEDYTSTAFAPTVPSVSAETSPTPGPVKEQRWAPADSPASPRTPATTPRPTESWTSSYVARARDSERFADRALHAKLEEEEQEAKDVILFAHLPEIDEAENGVMMNRDLLAGRKRISTVSPFQRGPRPIPEEKPQRIQEKVSQGFQEDLSSAITNLSEQNTYSKTHIRKQKTVPRKVTEAPVKVNEVVTEIDDEERIKDNLDLPKGIQDNNDRYAKSHIKLLKTRDNGNKDYSKLTFKDIRGVIPVPKLKKLLAKNGFTISDIFSRKVDALAVVDKALRSKSYLKDDDDEPASKSSTREIDNETEEMNDRGEDKRKDSPRKIDWNSKKAKPKKVKPTVDIDAEIEKEAATMDMKSLMKKISPMSISEVLQEVGFSLQDVMRGNKEAIKKVLRYHRQVTQPEPIPEEEDMVEEEEDDSYKVMKKVEEEEDDPLKNLDIEIKMWSPPPSEESKVTEPTEVEDRTTREPFVPSKKKNRLSSVDLFQKFRKFNKDPRAEESVPSTTARPTTSSANLVRSTTLVFGDRTTNKVKEKFTPTPRSSIPNDVMKKRQRVLNKFGFDSRIDRGEEEDNESSVTEASEEELGKTTTPYDVSLNFTLTNLNMTASDVIDKKNLTVPGIDALFSGITKEKTEVIYGEKRDLEKEKKEKKKFINTDFGNGAGREETKDGGPQKKFINTDFGGGADREEKKEIQPKKKFINTDFGGGAGRFRNSWSQGGAYGGGSRGGSRIVTNRRTTSTTRAPMTYFLDDEEPIGTSSTELGADNLQLLDGEGVVDYYDYYYYGVEPSEVPTGVKSALIASSVVGGLAVSIFLCIFILCLWKQMKNKLRMSMEYEEPRKAGFFAGLCYSSSGQEGKKETSGYFSKTPPSEQHYSTTSSEEY